MRLSLEKQKHRETSIILQVTCSLVLNFAFCLFSIPPYISECDKKQKQGGKGSNECRKSWNVSELPLQVQGIVKGALSLGSCVCQMYFLFPKNIYKIKLEVLFKCFLINSCQRKHSNFVDFLSLLCFLCVFFSQQLGLLFCLLGLDLQGGCSESWIPHPLFHALVVMELRSACTAHSLKNLTLDASCSCGLLVSCMTWTSGDWKEAKGQKSILQIFISLKEVNNSSCGGLGMEGSDLQRTVKRSGTLMLTKKST